MLPNATTKSIAHNISNLDKAVNIDGFAFLDSYKTSAPINFPSQLDNSITAYVDADNIVVGASRDRSHYHGYVTLQYTKTTD